MKLFPLLAAVLVSIGLSACSTSSNRAAWLTAPLLVPADSDAAQSIDLSWHDGLRDRPVAARLHLPKSIGTPASGKLPLVVVSHGLGGSRAGYSHLGRYWAENGFAVLHVQHAGSDREVWAGNPLSVLFNVQKAAGEDNAIARVHDVKFALDRLESPQHPLPYQLDTHNVVIAGHSYGANTAMLLSGADVNRDGRTLGLRDQRITAAILMSAPPFYGEKSPKTILSAITIPTLHLTSDKDIITVPGYYSAAQDRVSLFNDMPSGKKFLVVFQEGSHSVFTDRPDRANPEQGRAIKAATRQITLDFLQALRDRAATGGQSRSDNFSVVFDTRVRDLGNIIAKVQRD